MKRLLLAASVLTILYISCRSNSRIQNFYFIDFEPQIDKDSRPWSKDEDDQLFEWVRKSNPANFYVGDEPIKDRSWHEINHRWKIIGKNISTKSKPLRIASWSAKEDLRLLEKYTELGEKWGDMIIYFSKRTSEEIRDRLHFVLNIDWYNTI